MLKFLTRWLVVFCLLPASSLAMPQCPPGTETLPWAGTLGLFLFVLVGVAIWLWLHIKVVRRTRFRNKIIVHAIAFVIFCGATGLGLFTYIHFAILTCA